MTRVGRASLGLAALLPALALAQAELPAGHGDKLLLTGGVSQVEGAAGGGLTPWALIAGYGTRDQVGAQAFATAVGLDMATYNSCMDEQKHLPRIQANATEGQARGVNSTPTIIVGNKIYPGGLTADGIKKLVDSLTAAGAGAAPAADTAAKQ